MKNRVTMLEGYHLTATLRRDIVALLQYYRDNPDHQNLKRMRNGPKGKWLEIRCADKGDDSFSVMMEEPYWTDSGRADIREWRFVVRVSGFSHADFKQLQPSTELTQAGEQFVIPGYESNLSPKAVQLGLFG